MSLLVSSPALPVTYHRMLLIVATGTAIANAVADAIGAPILHLPVTPERVLQAIQQKSND